jgi:hypothetical protein
MKRIYKALMATCRLGSVIAMILCGCHNWATINKPFPQVREIREKVIANGGAPIQLDEGEREALQACLRGPVKEEFLDKSLAPEIYAAIKTLADDFPKTEHLYFLRYHKDMTRNVEISFDMDGKLYSSGGGIISSGHDRFDGSIYKPIEIPKGRKLKGSFNGIAYSPSSRRYRLFLGSKCDFRSTQEGSDKGQDEFAFHDASGRIFSLLVTESAPTPLDFVDQLVVKAKADGKEAGKVKLPSGQETFVSITLNPEEGKKFGKAKMTAIFYESGAIYDAYVISLPKEFPEAAVDDARENLSKFLVNLDSQPPVGSGID